ncbi:MAG: DUF6340 family protein [Bacteroidales bacterium]|nr:DUF6340 family protein [Bacteroidales bacterium]
MTGRIYIIGVFVVPLVLLSCTAEKSMIALEILKPASITYPANVQTIGYFDRSPLTFNAYANIDTRALNDTHLYKLDALINSSILMGFIEGKSQSSLFYMEDISYLQERRHDTLDQDVPLPNKRVDEICAIFGFDALITQDYYFADFNKSYYCNEDGWNELMFELHLNVKWTVNIAGQTKPLDSYTYNDTLYFVNQDKFPKIKYLSNLEMLLEGFKVVGQSFGIRNVPVWNKVSRIVFTGKNEDLRKAGKFTDKGDWESALKIWEENLSSENKKLAAKCAHNLAVYYELGDDINQALDYAKKANDLWPSPQIEAYMKDLNIRRLNWITLEKQLQTFKSR